MLLRSGLQQTPAFSVGGTWGMLITQVSFDAGEAGVESAEDAANFHVDKVRKSAVKDNMVVAIYEYLHGHFLLNYGYRSR
jgi:hypothetical protein